MDAERADTCRNPPVLAPDAHMSALRGAPPEAPTMCLDAFDPLDVLMADAVDDDPGEIHDFIDHLLNVNVSLPIDVPHGGGSARAYGKKHKLAHDMPMVGSPVSTLEMSVDFGVPLSSCPSPKRTESSPPSPPSEENVSSSPGLSRKNRPQRCSICKECGHKSRTCRFAQGKGAHATDRIRLRSSHYYLPPPPPPP